jgi:predicted nucleic acid-binding protein
MSKIFLDTNILLYTIDQRERKKRDQALRIVSGLACHGMAVISIQVLQEFYVSATRKFGIDPLSAKEMIAGFRSHELVVPDIEMMNEAIDGSILNRISFWDALIIASARRANCEIVWTEDLNHGQIIQGVRIENPFLKPSASGPSMVRESSAKRRPRRGKRDELYRV